MLKLMPNAISINDIMCEPTFAYLESFRFGMLGGIPTISVTVYGEQRMYRLIEQASDSFSIWDLMVNNGDSSKNKLALEVCIKQYIVVSQLDLKQPDEVDEKDAKPKKDKPVKKDVKPKKDKPVKKDVKPKKDKPVKKDVKPKKSTKKSDKEKSVKTPTKKKESTKKSADDKK